MSDDVGRATLSLLESLIEHLEGAGVIDAEDVAAIYEAAIERVRERRDASAGLPLELQASFARRRIC
jgi:hypothetical protein